MILIDNIGDDIPESEDNINENYLELETQINLSEIDYGLLREVLK